MPTLFIQTPVSVLEKVPLLGGVLVLEYSILLRKLYMPKVTFFVGGSTSVDLGSTRLVQQPVYKDSELRLLVRE